MPGAGTSRRRAHQSSALAAAAGRTVAMEAEMTRRQLLPACASALRMKCIWQRCAYKSAMWRRLSICLEQYAAGRA